LNHPVSLQINVAPNDYLHARYILPHQLKILSNQVNEVLIIIDSKPSKGRFGEGWDANKNVLISFLDNLQSEYPIKIMHVDYSLAIKTKIAEYFFGTSNIPEKDFRGGPFYAYFFGLFQAKNNWVFHLDSDMILGGGSRTWINEAINFFEIDKSYLTASPLPGPPHNDDILIGQAVASKIAPFTYAFNAMSTRIFMIDKAKFSEHKLSITKPSFRNQIKAILQGNPNADLPEHILSAYIKKHNLKRIDFLGTNPGLWSLHPPYRTKAFYNNLEDIIKLAENNNLPTAQNGNYDIINEVCDWTEAREKLKTNRWWKKPFHKIN
jgi:hypothetical protein